MMDSAEKRAREAMGTCCPGVSRSFWNGVLEDVANLLRKDRQQTIREAADYGATLKMGKMEIGVSGCSSEIEARSACYALAVKLGWEPASLRIYWWQLWKPIERASQTEEK